MGNDMTTPIATPQVINDVIPRTQATAMANQVTFNTNWTANAASDVLVYSRAAAIPADDLTQLVSSSDYVVEFVGTYQTVRITFVTGRTAGDIVTISRDTPASRTNLYYNTNFTPDMLNQDFGILTLVDQQAQLYDIDLAPHYNTSCSYTDESDINIDTILPILAANQFWVKNASNTKIITATLTDSGGLPSSGPFVTYTADDAFPDAFDLGLLSNGVLGISVTGASATPYSISTSTSGYVLTSNGVGVAPTFQATTISASVPTGAMLPFGGTSAPSGYVVCDGTAISRTVFADLFAVIGTTWGAGNGTTTFNVPNMARSVAVGSGGSGSVTLGNSVGNTGGEETHTQTINEMPAHTHTFTTFSTSAAGATSTNVRVNSGSDVTGSTGGGTAFNIMQPSAVVLYIIKT